MTNTKIEKAVEEFKEQFLFYSFDQLMLDYKVELSFMITFSLWDYSYQGSNDRYWWEKFMNVNHAFMDLKCTELI